MKQLTLEERNYIEIRKKLGDSSRSIARDLKRSHTTICREFRRNASQKGYRHKLANRLAVARKQRARTTKMNSDMTNKIDGFLQKDLSPEQIAGRLKLDGIGLHHETIYRYLLKDKAGGGLLYKHLRRQGRSYRKRYGYANNRTGIPNRVDIDERSEAANNRKEFGHLEADTIVGKGHQGVIVTLDERVSKLRWAFPLNSKHKDGVSQAIIGLLKPVKGLVRSITYDNGKEFAGHEEVNRSLDCNSYFAKPYHSWERGQNENANGLLRQYFPKSMKLTDVSVDCVKIAVHKLNSRPRKCLGFKTPYEVFFEITGVDAGL